MILFIIEHPPENLKKILLEMIHLHNQVNGTELMYVDVFEKLKVYSKGDFYRDAHRAKCMIPTWGYESEYNIGKTMLYGVHDGSIPEWMYGLIKCMGARTERFPRVKGGSHEE